MFNCHSESLLDSTEHFGSTGGRFEVGVCWGLYCLEHGESLDVDGFHYLGQIRSFAFPETVDRLRSLWEEDRFDLGPNETWIGERLLALVSAFVERHQDCKLYVWNDADLSFEKLIEIANEDPDWLEFSIWEDDAFGEHFLPTFDESHERHIRNLRSRLRFLEEELANGKLKWFRKRRTKRDIKRLRTWIPQEIESHAKWMKGIPKRQINREPHRDVLEDIKGKPISSYPRGIKTSK